MNKGKQVNKHLINQYIRSPKVRVVYEDINTIMDLRDALNLADSYDLDLVQMNDQQCPTCRIMNYSKYLFEEKRKKKLQACNKVDLKEVQLKPAICTNDIMIKRKQILGFLEKGHDVRVRLKLKNREKANSDEYAGFLMNFANSFASEAKIEAKIDPEHKMPVGNLVNLKPIKKITP